MQKVATVQDFFLISVVCFVCSFVCLFVFVITRPHRGKPTKRVGNGVDDLSCPGWLSRRSDRL